MKGSTQTSLDIEIHILSPSPHTQENYLAITHKLTSSYPHTLFKSFNEMINHPKSAPKLYRIISKSALLAHNEAIRRLSFAENRFIVVEEIGERGESSGVPKDLEHHVRIITKDASIIESHIEEYLAERRRVQLPERYVMCFNEKSYLEGLYLLLKVFDRRDKIITMKQGAGKENKLVFVVEIRGFAGVYQKVRAEYKDYQFGFIILSDYGVKEDLERKYTESCECEVKFYVSKESVSNYLLSVLDAPQAHNAHLAPSPHQETSTTLLSISQIKNIYNIGDLEATEDYLTVFDVWGRKTLKQTLTPSDLKSNTILIMKQQRIPELSLVISDQVNLLFVDKTRITNSLLQIPGPQPRTHLFIILNPNAKEILKGMSLLGYQKQNMNELMVGIFQEDADSQRVRKLEKVAFKNTPLIKLFSISGSKGMIREIEDKTVPNVLQYSHSNYQGHTNNKDYIILNESSLNPNNQFPVLSSLIVTLSEKQEKYSMGHIEMNPDQLPGYLKRQTQLLCSLRQSAEVLRSIGVYSLSSPKQDLVHDYFVNKLFFDFNTLNQQQITIQRESSSRDIFTKLSINKKQLHIIILQQSNKSLRSQMDSLITSRGYQNVYIFDYLSSSIQPHSSSTIQQILSLQYKFLHYLVETSMAHTTRRELNCPDYIHIRIFSIEELEIISFIERSVSKRKLFKYFNADEFYKILNDFKSDIKEILIMKAEDWREDMEESIYKLSISHLLNIETILIYANGAYIHQTFNKSKSKPQFLPEAQLKQKIEALKSIKEEEKEEKKQVHVLQKQLEELLRRQAAELDREFDIMTSNRKKPDGKNKANQNMSDYLFVNDSRTLDIPVCMVGSRNNSVLSNSLKTEKLFSSNIHDTSSRQIASVENLLLVQSGIYDDYDMKPPSAKLSSSTAKPNPINTPNQNKIQKNLLKKSPKKSSSKDNRLLTSTQKLLRSKSSLNSIKLPTLTSFKSSTNLNSKKEPSPHQQPNKTISIEDKKRFLQFIQHCDKILFLIYKKATPVEETIRSLMVEDKRIEYRMFGKVSDVERKEEYFVDGGEQTVLVVDKEMVGKGKGKGEFPESYLVMSYNCLKRKGSNVRTFNFEMMYDVSIFLSETMKVSVGVKSAAKLKKEGNGKVHLLEVPKEKEKKSNRIKTEKVLNQEKSLKKIKSDRNLGVKKEIQREIKPILKGDSQQEATKKQLKHHALSPSSTERLFTGSDMNIEVVSSFIVQPQTPCTLMHLKSPRQTLPKPPLSPFTIYIFSSVRISSLSKILESSGFYPVFLRPLPSSQILHFSQLLNPFQFIIINQEQQQNYNKILLSKIPSLIINSSLESLKSQIQQKISTNTHLLSWSQYRETNEWNPVYYHPRVSKLIQKWEESNKYQYLSFQESSISQKSALYLSEEKGKYKVYILKSQLEPSLISQTNHMEQFQSTLHKIQNTYALFKTPNIDSPKHIIIFYESEFAYLIHECSSKIPNFCSTIITSQFHVKDFEEISKLLNQKSTFGIFIFRQENISIYNSHLDPSQSSHTHPLPIFISSKSEVMNYRMQFLKLFHVLASHHNLLPVSTHKHQFEFTSNGIQDLFEMEEEAETSMNMSLSRLSMAESRVSRSSEKSLMRSSSKSRYSLLNKNRSNINELVIIAPETLIESYSLDSFISKSHKSIDLVPYLSMEDVVNTVRGYKKNQQYLIIFSHYSRLSGQIEEIINANKMIVIALTKKPYEQLLKSQLNSIYCSSQNLILTFTKVLSKLNQRSSPINAMINSEISQLITFKTGEQSTTTDLRHSERFNVCYPSSDLLKTEYKKEEYYFVSCKEGAVIDKRILRRNVFIFRDVDYLKYALFRVLKNYFLVKLKERRKERIVLPHKTTNPGKEVIFLTQRTSLEDIKFDTFVVAPRSRSHELSRYSNKILFYENKQQLTIIQNLLKFRSFCQKAEELLSESRKVVFYYHESLESTIFHILHNQSEKLSTVRFRNVGEISPENNLKVSIIICRVEEVSQMVEFLNRYRRGFKLIVLNFEQNKRIPLKQSLQVPIILNKEAELAKYLARQLKLFYMTIFLDKRLEGMKEELSRALTIKHEIHLVTSIEMKNKPKEITGIGFYLSDTNSLKGQGLNLKFVEVGSQDKEHVGELARSMETEVVGKEQHQSYY